MNRKSPPQWFRKWLENRLPSRQAEACLGDLEEKFESRIRQSVSPARARSIYILEGIGFLRLAHLKSSEQVNPFTMLRHTILFFGRLVRKNTSYYAVSLLGLTLSLSSFLFILMFIQDELSFDRFHQKSENVYRVTTHLWLGDVFYNMASSQFPAAQALRSELPEVEEACRLFPVDLTLEREDKRFPEQSYFVDDNFFKVFTFKWLQGDPESALSEPGNIILTKKAASRYFGEENPMGKSLITFGQPFLVTGVIEDVPEQSHMKFDVLIPLSFQLNYWKSQSGIEGRENKWFWIGSYTYLLLRNPSDAEAVRAKLPAITLKYFPERYKNTAHFELQALTDIHLNSNLDVELQPGGSMLYVRLFAVVALVIMVVSTINLVNLSYFKLNGRIREVGIRKFLGQQAAKITMQLCLEGLFLALLAFALTLIVCQIFLGPFNLLVQKNLSFWSGSNLIIIGIGLVIIVFISLVSVIRPAMRYGMQSSSDLLLKEFRNPRAANRVRNLMIGLQVCFSFVLLVFSFIISSQVDFFKRKDLGFDKENIVVVRLKQEVVNQFEAFKNELKTLSMVTSVTGAETPGNGYSGWRFVPEGGSPEKPLMLPFTSSDYSFLGTMHIKLVMGTDFDPNNKYDSMMPFIINKRAAIELGWLDNPIGKKMEVFSPGKSEIMARGRIIGMIDDFHFESLHKPVKPMVLTVGPYFETALVKLAGPVDQATIAGINGVWKKFSDKPFEYDTLDKKLEKLYANEDQLSHVILFFTFIALYLTCYGLFAMSSLLFSSRLKEVAIRKVFGADQFTIIRQFYSRYALFTLLAILIGLPLAMYVGNYWLGTFQYRIALGPAFFIKAGIWILLAGLISVSFYLARVAFSSPVKFLRNE